MGWISWFIDMLILFKGPNFKVKSISHIDHEGFLRPGPGQSTITEYIYNLKTLWNFGGSTWPPIFHEKGPPIKRVIRMPSGTDITGHVLRFAGPRRNEITPCAFLRFTKKWKIRARPFGVQISLEDYVEPVNENIQVETIFNQCFQLEPSKTGHLPGLQ